MYLGYYKHHRSEFHSHIQHRRLPWQWLLLFSLCIHRSCRFCLGPPLMRTWMGLMWSCQGKYLCCNLLACSDNPSQACRNTVCNCNACRRKRPSPLQALRILHTRLGQGPMDDGWNGGGCVVSSVRLCQWQDIDRLMNKIDMTASLFTYQTKPLRANLLWIRICKCQTNGTFLLDAFCRCFA